MRFFLLDKIIEYVEGESVKGVKCITLTDEIVHDHFPDHPIMPGSLIIEGMAQLAGFLLESTFNKDNEIIVRAVLMQVDKMKFYKISVPGDKLEYQVKIESLLEDAAKVSVKALCDGEIRCKGKINFQMMNIDTPNVTAQRLSIYKIWTKDLKNCPTLR